MNVDFEFGEKKHIKLRICSCKGTDFLIERASYELLYKGTQEVEDSGIAVIQGHILDVVIQPQKKGRYIEQTVKNYQNNLRKIFGAED